MKKDRQPFASNVSTSASAFPKRSRKRLSLAFLTAATLCTGLCPPSALSELPPASKAPATPTPLPTGDAAPVTAASLLAQVESRLHGVSIAQAAPGDLIKAVEKVVANNPKEAVAILAAALAVPRADWWELAGQIVGAAIKGLGPSASGPMIVNLVKIAVELQPAARLSIVHYAVLACDCGVIPQIVWAATRTQGIDSKNVIVSDRKNVVVMDNKNVVTPGSVVASTRRDYFQEVAQTAVDARHDCFADVSALQTAGGKEMPPIEEGENPSNLVVPTDPPNPPSDIKTPAVSN